MITFVIKMNIKYYSKKEDFWIWEDLYPVLQLNDKFLELFDFFIVFPDSLNM